MIYAIARPVYDACGTAGPSIADPIINITDSLRAPPDRYGRFKRRARGIIFPNENFNKLHERARIVFRMTMVGSPFLSVNNNGTTAGRTSLIISFERFARYSTDEFPEDRRRRRNGKMTAEKIAHWKGGNSGRISVDTVLLLETSFPANAGNPFGGFA